MAYEIGYFLEFQFTEFKLSECIDILQLKHKYPVLQPMCYETNQTYLGTLIVWQDGHKPSRQSVTGHCYFHLSKARLPSSSVTG